MKRKPIFMALVGGLLGAVGCGKSGHYPTTPDLKYQSIYPMELTTSDSIAITCSFKDQEGDVQGTVWYKAYNITTPADSTVGFADYPLPQFPPQKNMEGSVILILKPMTDFSVGAPAGGGSDSVYFDVFMKDNAGHISDTVRTDTVLVHSS